MRHKFLKIVLTGLFLSAFHLSANAGLIVGTNASDWRLSTVVESGGAGGNWTTLIAEGALPGLSTYTITPTSGGGVASPGAAALGVTGLNAGSGVSFFRTTFELFDIQSALVDVAVDNNIQIFINGHEVAREISLSGDNWTSILPSFDILSDGSIANIVKFDSTFAFSSWNEGENDVVLAVRNLDGGDSGGVAFRMELEGSAVPVSAPGTIALFGLSLAALGFVRRKKA
ncbi:PEP-CTERM sorting domain-containing protein [Neptunomonas antarctica]|uniref:PEP-CTERM protein-sorting domain-containing protein n=1 Tax=Neptunomonas antarctica TaxID=619304 RepID=A0A1N7LSK3_9GAMM|nr:PEP-CTERM sorting domain-containing protein [Neptunomonas antarctica]SIS76838.1 PEP-CTERM protein-sorting domain-containing protein [Neptunomonas antarctica]